MTSVLYVAVHKCVQSKCPSAMRPSLIGVPSSVSVVPLEEAEAAEGTLSMPRLLHHVLRAAANDAVLASIGLRCSSCGSLFCEDCDELLHDSLHACPGCDGICKQERGEEDPGNGKIG